jgi:hypothetical protein
MSASTLVESDVSTADFRGSDLSHSYLLQRPEVDGPDPVVDLLQSHVLADTHDRHVHPAAVPPNPAVGAAVAGRRRCPDNTRRAAGLPRGNLRPALRQET